MRKFFLAGILSILSLSMPSFAEITSVKGGIGLDVTRVIFPSSEESISLRVNNTSASDIWLLRSWISEYTNNEIKAPFLITPPLVRINQGERIQLRINKIADMNKLPNDRESVFNINVMAIPPENKEKKNTGRIQFSVNNRIKLFYRPESINNRKEIENLANNLKVVKTESGLKIINPTPYYATLDNILINGELFDKRNDYMVAPFSTLAIQGKNIHTFTYQLINDFGGWSKAVDISL